MSSPCLSHEWLKGVRSSCVFLSFCPWCTVGAEESFSTRRGQTRAGTAFLAWQGHVEAFGPFIGIFISSLLIPGNVCKSYTWVLTSYGPPSNPELMPRHPGVQLGSASEHARRFQSRAPESGGRDAIVMWYRDSKETSINRTARVQQDHSFGETREMLVDMDPRNEDNSEERFRIWGCRGSKTLVKGQLQNSVPRERSVLLRSGMHVPCWLIYFLFIRD